MKTTIVISGSLKRFATEMHELAQELREKGFYVYYPEIKSLRHEEFEKFPEVVKNDTAKGITLEYFEYIKRSDVMFVYNKDGYSGNSTTLEIGYAMALGKKIFALTHDTELCKDVLFDGYASNVEELVELI